MRVVVTGADGFLGWHTRVRMRALTDHDIVPVARSNWQELRTAISNADAVLHLAGVNRGNAHEVEELNVALGRAVAEAVEAAAVPPAVVFANSTQSGSDTSYGRGKERAAVLLAGAAQRAGSRFADVRLPNLFGEHCRPHYNSFVATFADSLVRGASVDLVDRSLSLMHVQQAAAALIGLLPEGAGRSEPQGTPTTVQHVYATLASFVEVYASGEIPPLDSDLDLDLFNTLRAAKFPGDYPIPLISRRDQRGGLVEVVRAHGGAGQTFVSTTRRGATRGEHFHLRKVERFVVVDGRARISLRRLFADGVVDFVVDGESPCIVDMPTMWVHNITNIGSGSLTTVFWTNELFDPEAPDTYAEAVRPTLERLA